MTVVAPGITADPGGSSGAAAGAVTTVPIAFSFAGANPAAAPTSELVTFSGETGDGYMLGDRFSERGPRLRRGEDDVVAATVRRARGVRRPCAGRQRLRA